MSMRAQWACPDLGHKKPNGLHNPIPGSDKLFDDCPAFYLRTVSMGLPAPHLIEGATHPATLVSQWAFEVESGSRNVETLSPKAIELVHLWLSEKHARESYESEKRGKGRR